jgi:hypothetical protein
MCSKGFDQNDLTNMMSILEVCTKRGAFQAEELSGIGQLYDKLKTCKDGLNQKSTQLTPRQTKIDEEEEGNCGAKDCCGEPDHCKRQESAAEMADLISKNSEAV